MDISDLLRSPQITQALQSLAQAYGIQPAQIQTILDTLLKTFSNNIERATLSRGGTADVVTEMTRPEHAAVLADPTHPAAADVGISALATILGSKAASRNVAAQAAMSSGIEQAIVQKLLPILASLIMAALSKGSSGGLGDILRKLPEIVVGGSGGGGGGGFPGAPSQPQGRGRSRQDDADQDAQQDSGQDQGRDQESDPNPWPNQPRRQPTPQSSDGGLGDILTKIPGFPGSDAGGGAGPVQGPMPNPGRAPAPTGGGGFGGSPLPIPGDRIPGINALNPYGNLPDVIRQGTASVDGTPVAGAIRSILGSLLGFENKGFLGWAFRLLVMRWGWGLLQRVLLGRR